MVSVRNEISSFGASLIGLVIALSKPSSAKESNSSDNGSDAARTSWKSRDVCLK
jgi:hypothetical protein